MPAWPATPTPCTGAKTSPSWRAGQVAGPATGTGIVIVAAKSSDRTIVGLAMLHVRFRRPGARGGLDLTCPTPEPARAMSRFPADPRHGPDALCT